MPALAPPLTGTQEGLHEDAIGRHILTRVEEHPATTRRRAEIGTPPVVGSDTQVIHGIDVGTTGRTTSGYACTRRV